MLSVALWIFAGVAALAGGVAIAIILTREISLASVDQPTLRALGLSRRQRAAINGYPALLIASGGARARRVGCHRGVAVVPDRCRTPRRPHLGVHVDWAGPGARASSASRWSSVRSRSWPRCAAPDGPRSTSTRAHVGDRRRIVEHRSPRPVWPRRRPTVCAWHSNPARGRTAVPVRSAYLGAVFGIAGLTAVLMFASSVQHLAATPRLYGWTADFAATDQNFGTNPATPADASTTASATPPGSRRLPRYAPSPSNSTDIP